MSDLADRIARRLAPLAPRVQRMFGGTCFLVNDNLVIGTMKDGLIVRVGAGAVPAALEDPFAQQARMGGREMTGWIEVSPDGTLGADLDRWIDLGLAFNATLPRAAAKAKAPRKG